MDCCVAAVSDDTRTLTCTTTTVSASPIQRLYLARPQVYLDIHTSAGENTQSSVRGSERNTALSQFMADMAAFLLQKSHSAVRLRKGLSQLCICGDSFKHWFVRWLKCFLWLTFVVLSKQLVRLPVWFGSPGVVMWKLLQFVGSGNTKQTQDLVIMCAACSVGLVS